MSSPIIGVRPQVGAALTSPVDRAAAGRKASRLLGWFGLALAAIGLADAALVFVPPLWGNAEWSFTTSAQLISGLPILAVALGAMTVAALGGGAAARRVVGGLNVLLVLAIVATMLLFVPAAGEALELGAEVAQPGIRKMIFRVGLFAVVFGLLHGALALRCFRAGQLPTDAAR